MGERSFTADPLVAERRDALARVCNDAAASVIDLVVEEASSAANLLGFGRDATRRYGDGIIATLPVATDAIREVDEAARARKIDALVTAVRAVSDEHRVPRLVERGLTAIAIRLARRAVRSGAKTTRFTADELEAEFVAFAEPFEEKLFSR